MNQLDRTDFQDLNFSHLFEENSANIEEQYRKILYINWNEETVFTGKIPKDSVQLWVGVGSKEVMDSYPFREISEYALSCLVTPVSYVVAERVFSRELCEK